MFCCYHAVIQGVSQKLNDGVDQCLYVNVGHSTQHNLHRTRVRLFSSMLWLFLAFGFLALSCTPLSGSSLRSTRISSLFSGLGRTKLLGMPFASRSLLVVLFVFELDTFSNCSVYSSLVMTHPLFLLIRLITPQKAYDLLPSFCSSIVHVWGLLGGHGVLPNLFCKSGSVTSVDYLSVKLTYSCLRSSAVPHCVS